MTTDAVECLLCHTMHTGSFGGNASRSWRCSRCHQQWDAARIATVIEYQRWSKTEAAAILHGAG